MTNPKKRLKKSIQSIEKQLALHAEKLRRAEENGNWALTTYYEREMGRMETDVGKRKKRLKK